MTQQEQIAQIAADVATLLERTQGQQALRDRVTAVAKTQADCIERQARSIPHADARTQNRIAVGALAVSIAALVCMMWSAWETRQAAKTMQQIPPWIELSGDAPAK